MKIYLIGWLQILTHWIPKKQKPVPLDLQVVGQGSNTFLLRSFKLLVYLAQTRPAHHWVINKQDAFGDRELHQACMGDPWMQCDLDHCCSLKHKRLTRPDTSCRNVKERTFRHVLPTKTQSDQSAHPRSLTRILIDSKKSQCILSYPNCAQWGFWFAQSDLNLRCAHMSEVTRCGSCNLFEQSTVMEIREQQQSEGSVISRHMGN